MALVGPGAVIVVLIKSASEFDLHGGLKLTPQLFRRWIRLALWWAGSALAVSLALWPALWANPAAQWRDLVHSAGLADTQHPQFFLGSVTGSPGIIYYPVAWAFRMTPWVFIGTLAVLIVCVVQLVRWCSRVWQRVRRQESNRVRRGLIPLWLVLACLPYALVISFAPSKFDRYVTPLLPFLALGIGVVVAEGARVVARRFTFGGSGRTLAAATGFGTTIVISVLTLIQAPYAISYTNPMLGGQKTARHVIMLGWGEGREALGAVVARREAGKCGRTTVAIAGTEPNIAVPCGNVVPQLAWLQRPRRGDYLITTIKEDQRMTTGTVLARVGRPVRLVDQVDIGGVAYARLWQVR